MPLKSVLFTVFCFLYQFSYGQHIARGDFRNVLLLEAPILHEKDVAVAVFSDLGAWHAYRFHRDQNGKIGFSGPLIMGMEGRWVGKYISRPRIFIDGTEKAFLPDQITGTAYPGMMEIKYTSSDIAIHQRLIFVSNRQSMILTEITNLTHKKLKVEPYLEGKFLESGRLTKRDREIYFDVGATPGFTLRLDRDASIRILDHQYVIVFDAQSMKPGEKLSYIESHIYSPVNREHIHTINTESATFQQSEATNEYRWNNYLNTYFANAGELPAEKRRLAVKAIITLITNWRSAAGDLHHDGLFPSVSYQGFYGFWSWDSWKQAVGLALFNPALAKSNILSMFDYMDDFGMVADCIYLDKSENNYRDTKPPLAAWAVESIFTRSGDTSFVQSIYPRLLKYHHWWYKNRDHDGNGLCEFGSTDGTRLAAAWESGMDNAVRFDSANMVRNNTHAWSLDQESVDLNAFLYAEKLCLANLADIIGLNEDAQQLRKESRWLITKIRQYLFDSTTGYFYDKKLNEHHLIKVAGPEGWLPLWARCADDEQARSVVHVVLDTARFNTFLPFPTLDASHPEFNPAKGYWRGPVWTDQLYFGLKGLRNYGYWNDANKLQEKFFNHAEGLTTNKPLYENYHPLTGVGLNAMNFSWTAAHILMLLVEDSP